MSVNIVYQIPMSMRLDLLFLMIFIIAHWSMKISTVLLYKANLQIHAERALAKRLRRVMEALRC